MTKNPIENRQIIELRANLQQLQEAADQLARLHRLLTRDLERALVIVLELPQDDNDLSQFPKEVFALPESKANSRTFPQSSRISQLRQQLLMGQEVADDLLRQQDHLKSTLSMALQEALELRHTEVEGMTELGGEG